ncbi:DUF2247 family protein [Kitasatospora sp. NPDC001547]|uniref:DUF2247 family protein n=1 Tax=Kitasatospora sp. NPDC001547 TaxID=3364015 RepID=UPI00368B6249
MSDMLKFKIPPAFIKPRVRLSLSEIKYGHHEGWIEANDVITLCTWYLDSGQVSQTEEALALLLSDEADQVAGILECADTGRVAGDVRSVWRFLALAWAYENRENLGDALGMVEILYADFDYPSEMESFVRYMPAKPGQKTGIDALISRWEEYVCSEGALYRSRGWVPEAD